MTYEKMDIVNFGRGLLETKDLDPIYVILYESKKELGVGDIKKWMLAYWCFYHAGVASKISESDDFYGTCKRAIKFKWPRGRERRHFRGDKSKDAIEWLGEHYPNPRNAVDELIHLPSLPILENSICRWPQFGPWIAYKAADMIERILNIPIKFPMDSLSYYKEPREAAKLWQPTWTLEQVVEKLIEHLGDYKAPPSYDRLVGVQEIETVLCKWKSHMNGHYPIGLDTVEIRHALEGYGPTSDILGEIHGKCFGK